MKSDHRHELKTNELAEWLGNLPQWTKENLNTIIIVLAVIAVGFAVYSWRFYSNNVLQSREKAELMNLLHQIQLGKMQIIQTQSQNPATDISHILLQPAAGLETFAKSTSKKQLAALALIKQAEAIRAEVHYGTADKLYIAEQINKAKDCYTKAMEKCPTNPTLTALAQFGLGLCEEELGSFDKAKEIYNQITANSDFKGTIAVTQAKFRLETMDDYTKDITFKPEPKAAAVQTTPVQTPAAEPNMAPETIAATVTSANTPLDLKPVNLAPNSVPNDSNRPFDISNLVSEIPIINPESANKPAIEDANAPGK